MACVFCSKVCERMRVASMVTRAFWLGALLLCASCLIGLTSPALAAPNSQAVQSFTGTWTLAALRKPPKSTQEQLSPTLSIVYYENEPFRGNPTRVFAYLARPAKIEEKVPAIVLVHGGGGTAFKEWAELWAERGYVAMAMDLAG